MNQEQLAQLRQRLADLFGDGPRPPRRPRQSGPRRPNLYRESIQSARIALARIAAAERQRREQLGIHWTREKHQ